VDGWQHAGSGVALGAGACWVAGMPGPAVALGAVTMGGFALLPDADHQSATFAHSAGPVTWVLANVIHDVTGGHRGVMHWGIGLAAISALFWVPSRDHSPGVRLAAAAVLALLIASCLHVTRIIRGKWKLAKGVRLPNRVVCLVIGAALAALMVSTEAASLWWLCAAGMGLHDLEDFTTGNGRRLAYNFLWPFSRLLWRGEKPHGTGYREAVRRSRADGAGWASGPPPRQLARRPARSAPARRRRRTRPSRRRSRS
jgi:hypothetical protein